MKYGNFLFSIDKSFWRKENKGNEIKIKDSITLMEIMISQEGGYEYIVTLYNRPSLRETREESKRKTLDPQIRKMNLTKH